MHIVRGVIDVPYDVHSPEIQDFHFLHLEIRRIAIGTGLEE